MREKEFLSYVYMCMCVCVGGSVGGGDGGVGNRCAAARVCIYVPVRIGTWMDFFLCPLIISLCLHACICHHTR